MTPSHKEVGELLERESGFTRERLDEWLRANCGTGLPHGEATTEAQMLHGLAYVLRQIEGTDSYRPHIGQSVSAASALRMALDHFASLALSSKEPS
jgi:hypothetical protein